MPLSNDTGVLKSICDLCSWDWSPTISQVGVWGHTRAQLLRSESRWQWFIMQETSSDFLDFSSGGGFLSMIINNIKLLCKTLKAKCLKKMQNYLLRYVYSSLYVSMSLCFHSPVPFWWSETDRCHFNDADAGLRKESLNRWWEIIFIPYVWDVLESRCGCVIYAW